jgi:hypothetical protein
VVLAVKMKDLPDYGVGLLIVTACLPPGCEFACDDGERPAYNLDEAGKAPQLFLEVDKDLLVGAVVLIEGMEEVLQVLNSEGGVAVELAVEYGGGDAAEGPDGLVGEANLDNALYFKLSKEESTSS